MKVLFLIERNVYLPWWEEAVQSYEALGVNLCVASVLPRGTLHDFLTSIGCANLALGCTSSRHYPKAVADLARFARTRGIDVLHGVEPIASVLTGLAARGCHGTVAVYHRQHSYQPDATTQNRLSKVAAYISDHVIACSEGSVAAALRYDRVPASKVSMVHNGTATPRDVGQQELDEFRTRLGIELQAPVLSTVARLRPVKRVDHLIQAADALGQLRGRPLDVVIAGDGPSRPDLEALAKVSPGARVHFLGQLADVAPVLRSSTALVMPSVSEGLPYAGVEAMACGVPVVGYRVPGMTELVDPGRSGVLVEDQRPDSLARTLSGLVSDPAQRTVLGKGARRRYESHFTAAKAIGDTVSVYRELKGR